jgi:hypothetical protein
MNNIHLHIIGSAFFILLNELDLNYNISLDKNLKYNNQDFLLELFLLKNYN